MNLSSEEVEILIRNPDKAAKKAHLVYTSEEELCIIRKKKGESFEYLKNGKTLSDPQELERIKKLVIPPAWEEVKICTVAHAHLQVVGRDAKNRKQYLYHPHWSELRNETKFFKLAAFGKILPKIRAKVDRDLDLPGMPQQKVLALIIRLMEETHIRIGNDCYARRNKSYGLSTLRSRHVKISRGKVKFDFIGKKGKEHSVSIRNKKLIKLVNQCEEIPGWEVFKYYDDAGQKQSIDSGMVNDYIHQCSGEMYSAKDFRTWSATKIFFEYLREEGFTDDEKANKKNILKAYDATAAALNNTRSVCRDYYVHPKLVKLYETGGIVPYFDKVVRKKKAKPFLSQTEEVLLEMIQNYEIVLGTEHTEEKKNRK